VADFALKPMSPNSVNLASGRRSRALPVAPALIALGILIRPASLRAQDTIGDPFRSSRTSFSRSDTGAPALDSLLQRALATSPIIRAAAARLDAARHRISPAAAWPDPRLTAGLQNQPLGKAATVSAHGTTTASGPDPMTMRVVGVSQTIPYPGKLRLGRSIAEGEAEAAEAGLDATWRQVVRDVKAAYYELAFLDRALTVVDENQATLATLIHTTESGFSVGQTSQRDVLEARTDATQLAETASSLLEQRRAALARLNALLDRASDAPLEHAAIPEAVRRAAVGDSSKDIRFASAALGARAADSPLPALTELQEEAVRRSPELREHEAMIAAQTARLELARKGSLPDFDVAVEYGQRGGNLPDMLSATVSVPIPLHKRQNQDELTAAAASTLASLHAEHGARVNALQADVARLVSQLEGERTQLALYRKAILPQGRAALASATTSYTVGKIALSGVLESQTSLFTYETDYDRALTDFATNLAELERVVGKEVLP
ncbi:MAG TPA: TolC family protein, partial [Gemmatimonadaceae bacterium]|nr:TolC family protein [Gemmatimonadaceae bacterium]